MRNIKFLIPQNLNIDEIIKENKSDYMTHPFRKEKLLFVCDALIKARISQRKEMEQNNTDYANLSSSILQFVIRDYNTYLQFLLAAKVMICNRHFKVGKFCMGYKFNPAYVGQPLKEVSVENYILKKRIRLYRISRKKEIKKNTWGYSYLTKWFDCKKLSIDKKSAFRWIDDYEKSKIEVLKTSGSYSDLGLLNILDTARDFKSLIVRIENTDYHYAFSGAGHRFYSPLTNLKRELKQFLTFDGQKIVSIDIKNSQPFLSLALFKHDFWGKKKGKLRLESLNREIYNTIRNKEEYKSIITLVNTSETLTDINSGLEKYRSLVLEGLFYEYIQEYFADTYPERFSDRPRVKKEVMRILFSDPKKEHWSFYKPCLDFYKHFPVPYQLFKMIKQIEYNYFPIILQAIESFLVIDVICKRISDLNAEIPIFTIHDNILTTIGNEGFVASIMTEEIKGYIGHTPTLDIQYL